MPLQLLQDTQKLWSKHTQQCKSNTCIQQQFDLRTDDLNFMLHLSKRLPSIILSLKMDI